jgi:hypothetical protein
VKVFRTENILLIDETVPQEKIAPLKNKAAEEDILLMTFNNII